MNDPKSMQSAMLLGNKAVELARLNDMLARGGMVKFAVPVGNAVLVVTETLHEGGAYLAAQTAAAEQARTAEEAASKDQRGSYNASSRV